MASDIEKYEQQQRMKMILKSENINNKENKEFKKYIRKYSRIIIIFATKKYVNAIPTNQKKGLLQVVDII